MILDGMDPVSVYTGLTRVAARMRKRPFPFLIEAKTYRLYHHQGRIPGSAFGYRTKEEETEWKARDPLSVFPATLAAEGLVTPDETEALHRKARESIQEAVAFPTEETEGKRQIPPAKWPPRETVTRDVRGEDDQLSDTAFVEREDFGEFKEMSYVDAVAGATLRNMERDERVFVLGEEVANLGAGAYKATKGIGEVFPERLINTPISECGFVGMAGGAASVGLRPVVEIMFPDFALMASDQLFNQIGKLRHMYGGNDEQISSCTFSLPSASNMAAAVRSRINVCSPNSPRWTA